MVSTMGEAKRKQIKVLTFSDLIHLDFFLPGSNDGWRVTMRNRDPEGFLVSLREIDPSVRITGFGQRMNKVEIVYIDCIDLEKLQTAIMGRYPAPVFADAASADQYLAANG